MATFRGPLDASLWPAIDRVGDGGWGRKAPWRYRQENARACCLSVLFAARETGITDEPGVEIQCECRRSWSLEAGWWRMPDPPVQHYTRTPDARLGRAVNSQHRARARVQMAERVARARK